MKYSTVEIRPTLFKDGEWCVHFEDLPHDREDSDGALSAMGFFHYPRKLGKKAAFEKLKSYMITEYKKEIDHLNKSMESLMRVELI